MEGHVFHFKMPLKLIERGQYGKLSLVFLRGERGPFVPLSYKTQVTRLQTVKRSYVREDTWIGESGDVCGKSGPLMLTSK